MKFKDIQIPSNRNFGILFSLIFFIVSTFFYSQEESLLSTLFISLSILSLFIAFVRPKLLYPFNKLWMFLGFLIGSIVSPLVLGLIFFGILTPIAIILRLVGRDELLLKRRMKKTYWKERYPLGPESPSFKNQF